MKKLNFAIAAILSLSMLTACSGNTNTAEVTETTSEVTTSQTETEVTTTEETTTTEEIPVIDETDTETAEEKTTSATTVPEKYEETEYEKGTVTSIEDESVFENSVAAGHYDELLNFLDSEMEQGWLNMDIFLLDVNSDGIDEIILNEWVMRSCLWGIYTGDENLIEDYCEEEQAIEGFPPKNGIKKCLKKDGTFSYVYFYEVDNAFAANYAVKDLQSGVECHAEWNADFETRDLTMDITFKDGENAATCSAFKDYDMESHTWAEWDNYQEIMDNYYEFFDTTETLQDIDMAAYKVGEIINQWW